MYDERPTPRSSVSPEYNWFTAPLALVSASVQVRLMSISNNAQACIRIPPLCFCVYACQNCSKPPFSPLCHSYQCIPKSSLDARLRFALHEYSQPRMATNPGGPADDGNPQQESTNQQTLDTTSPLRNLVFNNQRRVTRAFKRGENLEVPEVLDA